MRLVSIGVLVVTAALFAGPVAATPAQVGVHYSADGQTIGELTIANAHGATFMAWAIDGSLVAGGPVQSSYDQRMVPNHGLSANGSLLLVRVGEQYFVLDEDGWHWD